MLCFQQVLVLRFEARSAIVRHQAEELSSDLLQSAEGGRVKKTQVREFR